MAVVPTCPRCRGVLAGTGGRETCRRCGEVVVAVARKLCARCGEDVTNARRFKDTAGEYYCEACWLEVCDESGATPAYPCAECGGWFAAEQVYQRKSTYVCTGCYEARTTGVTSGDQAEATLAVLAGAGESPEMAAAEAYAPSPYAATVAARVEGRRRKMRRRVAMLVAAAVAAVVLLGAWLAWTRAG